MIHQYIFNKKCIYRVVRRNFPIGLSLHCSGLRGCKNFSLYVVDTHIPKLHIGIIKIYSSQHILEKIKLFLKIVRNWLSAPSIFFHILRLFEVITTIFDLKLSSYNLLYSVVTFFRVNPSIGQLWLCLVSGNFSTFTSGLQMPLRLLRSICEQINLHWSK